MAIAVVILLFLVGLCFAGICTICGDEDEKNKDEIDEEKNDENREATEPNESTRIMN